MKYALWFLIALLSFSSALLAQNYKDEAMSLFFAGQNAYNQGNYADAEQYLSRALQLDPDIEAKTPNAKFMLGVSAFKNQNYSIAKVNLSLYRDNPIAVDLLNKIIEIEGQMGTGFYYYTQDQNRTPIIETSAPSTPVQAESVSKSSPPVLLTIAIVFGVTLALSLFMELKFAIFSRFTVRLILAKNTVPVTVSPIGPTGLESPPLAVSSKDDEAELLLLSDTPFEEKIDIQKMASAEIEDIARFFSENPEIDVRKRETGETALTEEEIAQLAKNEILQASRSDASFEEEPKAGAEVKHLVFDELDLPKVLQLAQTLIAEAESEGPQEANEQTVWKSADEFSDEMEKNIDYFDEKNEVDEDDLSNYLDLFFKRETEALSK
ncbi:MAG TPA: tetratricopeptide repeat protein [Thermotogota bacterium]|nr:tetratricopeptide repeat protein [Thermotogota bacterium]